MLVIALLRGGEGKQSVIGIDSCSEASWLLLIAGQVLGFALSLMAYHQNKHIYKAEDEMVDEKDKSNLPKKNLEDFMERRTTNFFSLIRFLFLPKWILKIL